MATTTPPTKRDSAARRQAASVAVKNKAFPSTMYLSLVVRHSAPILRAGNSYIMGAEPSKKRPFCQLKGQEI